MRTVRMLLAKTGAWGIANFGLVMESITYTDAGGFPRTKQTKRESHYSMTKDGFMLLVMRFTGEKALQIEREHIERMADLMSRGGGI